MAFNPAHQNPEYEIGILCALSFEATAVKASFDEICEGEFKKSPADINSYTTGRIGRHKVVLCHMSGAGKAQAAAASQSLLSSFGDLKLALLVGACGGVPSSFSGSNIGPVLGDIVIGRNVVQIDLGRQYPDQFVRKQNVEDSLGRQRMEVRNFVGKLESGKESLQESTAQYLATLLQKPGLETLAYPGTSEDKLFSPDYLHKHHDPQDCKCVESLGTCDDAKQASCEQLGCEEKYLVHRDWLHARATQSPTIHFGTIASGDAVMKSGKHRDEVAHREGAIAFEMESAGIWDSLPCFVVKGICDYADSHKSKQWQGYAAAAAAACAKTIVEKWEESYRQPSAQPQINNSFNNHGSKILNQVVGNVRFAGGTFNL